MTWPSKGRRHTRADRAITTEVLRRAHGQCQIRGPHCTGVATEDDHIIPLSQGGSDALTNRRATCHTCHQAKSQAEATAARAAAAAKTVRPKLTHPGLR